MNIVRRYAVKVHALHVNSAGEPFGDTYRQEVSTADAIGQAVSECVASAESDGMRVHTVIVESFGEFQP
jgi:hypothetical protein